MLLFNLIEYSDNYSKTSGCLWQYYRDDQNDNITQSASRLKKQEKILLLVIQKTLKQQCPLKYLSKFCRTLEMPLINCEISLILT